VGSSTSAPVALFAFRRPTHLRETLNALALNDEARSTEVVAFVDAAADVADRPLVDAVCETLAEFGRTRAFAKLDVHRATEPKGLARSVIEGLSLVLAEHDRVIGLEDDIVLAPSGLAFLNSALDAYSEDRRVWSVSAFSPALRLPRGYDQDVYFSPRASSWGYGTWRDRWDEMSWDTRAFERLAGDPRYRRKFARGGNDLPPMLDKQLSGEIDSWAVRWCARQAEIGALTVYPVRSLVRNSGLDGSGTHSPVVEEMKGQLGTWNPGASSFPQPVLRAAVTRRFRGQYVSRTRLLASKLWQMRRRES
jgi:hypothetical protein